MNNRTRCNNVSRSADKFPTISGAVKSWKYRKGLVLSTNRTFFNLSLISQETRKRKRGRKMGYSRKLFLFGLTCRLSLTGIGNSRDVCTFEYVEE